MCNRTLISCLLAGTLLGSACSDDTGPGSSGDTGATNDVSQSSDSDDDASGDSSVSGTYTPVILAAEALDEHHDIPRPGDLWMVTWADDDALYLTWGDGTGRLFCFPSEDGDRPIFASAIEDDPGCFRLPGSPCVCDESCTVDCEIEHLTCNQIDCFNQCQPICPTTDAGLLRFEGAMTAIGSCDTDDDCVASLHIPANLPDYGWPELMPGKNDKPSSLLFLDGQMIYAGHRPAGEPTYGYLAHSEDYGQTWTELESSPWGSESNFRVAMFINMGQAYALNSDGYVYAFGISHEISQDLQPMSVYLARVPRASVLDYDAYEYFSGMGSDGQSTWAANESAAVAIEGLSTMEQGSSIYHEGIERYLFLTAAIDTTPEQPGALFEAPAPWGPWVHVAEVMTVGQNPRWLAGHYIASLVSKGAGPTSVYFTIAGGNQEYNLHIGRIELTLAE